MSQIGSLKGLVALVTGGASGLGCATVQRFIRQGARVVLLDLPSSDGRNVAGEIHKQNCVFAPADVTSEEDVTAAVDMAVKHFGEINVAVNCAGISAISSLYSSSTKSVHRLDAFEKILQVNTVGTFNVCRLVVPVMRTNEPNADGQRGVIVNTSSNAAFDGMVGQLAYATSKAAITGMTLPLARELSLNGIRAVDIAPGFFRTPLASQPEKVETALCKVILCPKKFAEPDIFAHMVQCIVENPYLNATTIRLDGGLRIT